MGRWGNSGREILEIPNTCHDLLDRLPSVREILPPKRNGIIRLAYMGYLDASRGSRWLLDLCGDHSNKVELVVAGDCRSKELAAELRSTPNVIYVGRLPYEEALSLMCEMDAVTIFCDLGKPSYRIADPTKFYDAMMVGTPVLATAGTSIDKLVSENKLGYVLEHNSMDDLCRAVRELRNLGKKASMRARCRQYYLDNLRLSEKLVGYRQFYSRVTKQWFTDET
jgi:glycosyltransferase involved in cell wall biosynthesis